MTPATSTASMVLDWLHGRASPGSHLRLDSRAVQAGDVFLAYVGARSDGRDFIGQALERGAGAIVFDDVDPGRTAVLLQTLADKGVPGLPAAGLKPALGAIASGWYGEPSREMRVIAVTGTNGKTSCAQWIARALTEGGMPCGAIGTLGIQIPGADGGSRSLSTGLTTPDAVALHRALADMRRDGVEAVAIEASSIGIAEGRLDGLHIDIAVFTNLTRDHLDYHGDMAAYEAEKAKLFAWEGVSAAVVNRDDEAGRRLIQALRARGTPAALTEYALGDVPADEGGRALVASDLHATSHGMVFTLTWQGQSVQISTPLLGAHNVSNLLAVGGVLLELGWSVQRVSAALSSAQPAPGRLQAVAAPGRLPGEGGPLVVVDYAHTPDALARALEALAPVAQARGGRRICVFGCGGDRDPGKRPQMAQAACEHADIVVVTSDNPRSELPQSIIDQILAGVPAGRAVSSDLDRARAIRDAVRRARPEDVILLAGKGHESYQEVGGVRHPFSDVEQAALALAAYCADPVETGLMTLADAARAMRGVVHGNAGADGVVFSGVGTDSRNVTPGELFVALSGERFDGHAYVRAAGEAGAVAAVVQRPVQDAGLPQVVVADTRRALGDLAAAWRSRFSIPVVGVTGSNGKTTTKEMIAAIFAARYGEPQRLATQGNLNNDIGVPLTIMRLRDAHRSAVVELGMNHPGEIAELARIAAPTVALVNNAQREHQEFMHTVEAVARENGAVISALAADGVAVFPGDDAYTSIWAELAGSRRCLRFGLVGDVEVSARDIRPEPFATRFVLCTPDGEAEVTLAAAGMHNVRNALAAAACALGAGVDLPHVARGLADFAPVKGRMQRHRLPGGALLIDDTYNANPDSVRAAIDVLASLPGPRALVLGDMGEVGDQGPAMHAEVGAYAKERGIDALFALGEATRATAQAFGSGSLHADGVEQLASAVMAIQPASVLVKGSRFMRMERVVQALQAGRSSDHSSIGNKHAA